jgi:hypothetical protein
VKLGKLACFLFEIVSQGELGFFGFLRRDLGAFEFDLFDYLLIDRLLLLSQEGFAILDLLFALDDFGALLIKPLFKFPPGRFDQRRRKRFIELDL